jgi:hypothetical protein
MTVKLIGFQIGLSGLDRQGLKPTATLRTIIDKVLSLDINENSN